MDDLISRQDAIKAIDEKAKRIKNADTLNGLAGAVGILFDLPSYNSIKTELSGDAVSRQAVNEIINDIRDCISVEGYCAILERLKKLPSVTQKSETVTEFADRCRECGAKYGKLLNQEPCEDANANQHNSNALNDVGQHTNALDAISRQAALDLLEDTNNGWIINEVSQLPSVNPQPCEDAISRQAVMDCFKKWQPYMATRLWDFEQELSALPSVSPQPCEDAISRQAVIDAICDMEILKYRIDLENVIKALPPIKPQEKTGHWKLQPSNKEQGERDFIWWKCSKCGQVIFSETEKDRREYHAFCGRCGARMVEPQERSDKE